MGPGSQNEVPDREPGLTTELNFHESELRKRKLEDKTLFAYLVTFFVSTNWKHFSNLDD